MGQTISNYQCKRYPSKGGNFCSSHTPKNTECPICLCAFSEDERANICLLKCKHFIHQKECILNLSAFECPICRARIERSVLGKKISRKIVGNIGRYKKYLDKENMRRNREMTNEIRIQNRRGEEIKSAIDFLEKIGVPTKFIPNYVAVKEATDDHPSRVPTGYFRDLVFETTRGLCGEMFDDIADQNIDENDPNFESYSSVLGVTQDLD